LAMSDCIYKNVYDILPGRNKFLLIKFQIVHSSKTYEKMANKKMVRVH
jgi:hypothetical protein